MEGKSDPMAVEFRIHANNICSWRRNSVKLPADGSTSRDNKMYISKAIKD